MRKYYNLIDLIRFAAAFMVLVHHLAGAAWRASDSLPAKVSHLPGPVIVLTDYGYAGWVGVQIFFVISGIVIANSAFGRTTSSFLIGRASRLYPAAIVCAPIAAIILFLVGALEPNWQVSLLKSMILSPIPYWLDPVIWTLSVEIAFYALVAIATYRDRFNLEQIACFLTLWSAVWLVLIIVFGDFNVKMLERTSLLRYGSFFAVGVFMWLTSERRATRVTWAIAPLSVALCLAEISKAGRLADAVTFTAVAALVLWSVSVIIMAYSLETASAFRSGWMSAFGKLTYPLYLCHTTIGGGAMYAFLLFGFGPNAAFWLGATVAIAGAWAIATYWEPPVSAIMKKQLTQVFDWVKKRRETALVP